ncbi:hypothetical protein Cob_v011538 [Colletotrichum orbiculare MAFF 240422]|uniref:Uncharacterized protein n=1 Tax=Colletotrichum orbiculare (strain 104-T / ATCC 96160 / CBS 514.97 / LARS 414 / MAFF 240422) TaxID=1213857 RepID=A0A484FD42_COLOR|nr:hypothetical protein Cob_v011538 [Colletotrichum orbiculare MAFF 240422]
MEDDPRRREKQQAAQGSGRLSATSSNATRYLDSSTGQSRRATIRHSCHSTALRHLTAATAAILHYTHIY